MKKLILFFISFFLITTKLFDEWRSKNKENLENNINLNSSEIIKSQIRLQNCDAKELIDLIISLISNNEIDLNDPDVKNIKLSYDSENNFLIIEGKKSSVEKIEEFILQIDTVQ